MANEQTRGPTDFATQNTDTGSEVKSRAREAVSQAKERAGEKIESRISESKTKAAETLSGVASTLLSSSQQLRENNQDGAGRAMERAAEGVERFASYLQQTNVDDVVGQVQEFARRQPAAFIGGAFALGFIASRFIKAKSPSGSHRLSSTSEYGRDYNTSYETSRTYQSGLDSEGELGSVSRGAGFGNTGDVSGSLGYGAGLSTSGGGTTGGGYQASATDTDRTGGDNAGSR
jgi:gas vesicle protein